MQTIQTPKEQKWVAKLQDFQFEIFNKPKKHNHVADALSCIKQEEALLFSISFPIPKKKGLLQPLEIPLQLWDELSMDFITYLPSAFGHTTIWVIYDRLIKYMHLLALPTSFTTRDLARRFSIEICRLHGIPRSIVSDRDPLFVSAFWKEIFASKAPL